MLFSLSITNFDINQNYSGKLQLKMFKHNMQIEHLSTEIKKEITYFIMEFQLAVVTSQKNK